MPKLLLSLTFLCLLAAKAPPDNNSPVSFFANALKSTDAKQVERARENLILLGDKVVNELEDYKTDDEGVASSIKYILNRICNYYIRIDPKREKDIKSPGGNGIQVMLSIKNNTTRPVKLCWIDRTGKRVPSDAGIDLN